MRQIYQSFLNDDYVFIDAGASIRDIADNGAGNIAVLTSGGTLRDYDHTGKPLGASISITAGSAVGYLDTTHCIITDFSSSTVRLVDMSTRAVTSLGSVGVNVYVTRQGQIATDLAGKGIGVRGASGNLFKFDLSGPSATSITPGFFSGKTASVVSYKTGTNFFIGTYTGQVYEMTYTGSLVQTITLPTYTTDSGSVTPRVDGISFEGDNLYVTCSRGLLYHYTYSTSTLNSIMLVSMGFGKTSDNNGVPLSKASNGLFLVGQNATYSNVGISLFEALTHPMVLVDRAFSPVDGPNNMVAVGILPTVKKGYCSLTPGTGYVWIFSIKGFEQRNISTRAQDPAGTDVTGNVIRIMRTPMGQYKVELAQSITAGNQNITSKHDTAEYYEIGYRSGSPPRRDIRQYTL